MERWIHDDQSRFLSFSLWGCPSCRIVLHRPFFWRKSSVCTIWFLLASRTHVSSKCNLSSLVMDLQSPWPPYQEIRHNISAPWSNEVPSNARAIYPLEMLLIWPSYLWSIDSSLHFVPRLIRRNIARYGTREVLFLISALSTCDPGPLGSLSPLFLFSP